MLRPDSKSPIKPPINLEPLDSDTIDHFWNHPLHNLGQYPPIGSAQGSKPVTANDRMMGAFGSVDWPQPLMPVDQRINGPKGRMFKLAAPTSRNNLKAFAQTAVQSDQPRDRDILLSHIRIVSLLGMFLLARFHRYSDTVRRHLPFSSI